MEQTKFARKDLLYILYSSVSKKGQLFPSQHTASIYSTVTKKKEASNICLHKVLICFHNFYYNYLCYFIGIVKYLNTSNWENKYLYFLSDVNVIKYLFF